MKLWSSFKKELVLATRSFYFYIEVFFAVVLLSVLLFAIPEHAQVMRTSYVYLNMPEPAAKMVTDLMLEEDVDGKLEETVLKADGKEYKASLVGKEEENLYILESEEIVRMFSDTQMNTGAVVSLGSDNELRYKYYLQGYESLRLKNLISVLHNIDSDILEQSYDNQKIEKLSALYEPLNDRENAIPPLLAFNSCLMGMFIISAYVFLDKKEGVIKAYAVTASSVPYYMLSKILVVLATASVSALIILLPVMGFSLNYALVLLLLLTSGFFSSVLGLLAASFYKDIVKAFGTIFVLLILMTLPAISYFLPGWDPAWVQFIPSDPIIQGLKEIIMPGGSAAYVLIASAGFLAAGVILFLAANIRFKRTLSV